jgi:NAD(P)-dependent dehydrogenase (short-subunit alcohol dehydrogenase family)
MYISSINFCESRLEDDLNTIFQTNVVGVSNVTKEFLPLLRKRGQDNVKKIVNISSILGSIELINQVSPAGAQPSYNISKAALNMYVKMLANNLAKENFVVYSSHPGWVKTDMGGDSAPVEIKDSIAGQLAKLESVTAKDNGGFFDFEGKTLPW